MIERAGQEFQNDALALRKTKLEEKLAELCERYKWLDKENKPRLASAFAILTSNLCEQEVEFLFRNPPVSSSRTSRFDRYWKEKSDTATFFIVSNLASLITETGFNVRIATEARVPFGHYDISLISGNPCRVTFNGTEILKIEIKGSSGISLSQITRYLYEPSPLLLVRVLTAQVTLLEPTKLQEYICFSIDTMIDKVDRILGGKYFTIKGKYCSQCPDVSCPYNLALSTSNLEQNKKSFFSFVGMSDNEFNWDIQTFFRNLKIVSEKTADIVLQELCRHNSESTRRTGEI